MSSSYTGGGFGRMSTRLNPPKTQKDSHRMLEQSTALAKAEIKSIKDQERVGRDTISFMERHESVRSKVTQYELEQYAKGWAGLESLTKTLVVEPAIKRAKEENKLGQSLWLEHGTTIQKAIEDAEIDSAMTRADVHGSEVASKLIEAGYPEIAKQWKGLSKYATTGYYQAMMRQAGENFGVWELSQQTDAIENNNGLLTIDGTEYDVKTTDPEQKRKLRLALLGKYTDPTENNPGKNIYNFNQSRFNDYVRAPATEYITKQYNKELGIQNVTDVNLSIDDEFFIMGSKLQQDPVVDTTTGKTHDSFVESYVTSSKRLYYYYQVLAQEGKLGNKTPRQAFMERLRKETVDMVLDYPPGKPIEQVYERLDKAFNTDIPGLPTGKLGTRPGFSIDELKGKVIQERNRRHASKLKDLGNQAQSLIETLQTDEEFQNLSIREQEERIMTDTQANPTLGSLALQYLRKQPTPVANSDQAEERLSSLVVTSGQDLTLSDITALGINPVKYKDVLDQLGIVWHSTPLLQGSSGDKQTRKADERLIEQSIKKSKGGSGAMKGADPAQQAEAIIYAKQLYEDQIRDYQRTNPQASDMDARNYVMGIGQGDFMTQLETSYQTDGNPLSKSQDGFPNIGGQRDPRTVHPFENNLKFRENLISKKGEELAMKEFKFDSSVPLEPNKNGEYHNFVESTARRFNITIPEAIERFSPDSATPPPPPKEDDPVAVIEGYLDNKRIAKVFKQNESGNSKLQLFRKVTDRSGIPLFGRQIMQETLQVDMSVVDWKSMEGVTTTEKLRNCIGQLKQIDPNSQACGKLLHELRLNGLKIPIITEEGN